MSFSAHSQPGSVAVSEKIIFEPHPITANTISEIISEENAAEVPVYQSLIRIDDPDTPEKADYVNQLETYQDQVQQLLVTEGVYSPDLIDYYLSMANILVENEQFAQAKVAYEEAKMLLRIEQGLDAELQVPELRGLAIAEMETGNILDARKILYRMVARQYAQSETPGMELLYTVEHAENLTTLGMHAYHHNTASFVEVYAILYEATRGYNFLRNNLAQDVQNYGSYLIELNRKSNALLYSISRTYQKGINSTRIFKYTRLPKTDYQVSVDADPDGQAVVELSGGDEAYFSDGMSLNSDPGLGVMLNLQYELSYKISRGESDESIARTMIDLADWYLLLGKKNLESADTLYEETRQFLTLAGLSDMLQSEPLQEIPVQIPEFVNHDYTSEAFGGTTQDSRNTLGYIDVSFQVNEKGRVRQFKVLNESTGLDEKYRTMLSEDIKGNQYRPVVEDKLLSKTYTLRYIVSALD